MNEKELDAFVHSYYQAPDPTRVPEALAYVTTRDLDPSNSASWYFFARIIQDHQMLLREVEQLFRDNSSGRMFLLAILCQSGDDRSRAFLERCISDSTFSAIRDLLTNVTQHWQPRQTSPIQRRPETAYDLDLLWSEFMASGATAAVARIIDALDAPDLVRTHLETYLRPVQSLGFFSCWRMKRTIAKLTRAGIWVDAKSRTIVSPQDLDCHVTMENLTVSRERLAGFLKILPFTIVDQELQQITTKASAKWSLGANAQRHKLVLQTCESESVARRGACRLALLEVAAYASLAANDLQSAFNRLNECLTVDAGARERQNSATQSELTRLAELTTIALEGLPAAGVGTDVSELKKKCVVAMDNLKTYCSELILGSSGDSLKRPEAKAPELVLRLEFVRPDKFRVIQRAGADWDEWVTVSGRTFRAPVWTEKAAAGNESSFNEVLLADGYLALLQDEQPLRVQFLDSDQVIYAALSYGDVAGRYLPKLLGSSDEVSVNKAVLWIDQRSGYLVKAQFDCLRNVTGEAQRAGVLVHHFCSQDAPIRIVPPAFQLSPAGQSLLLVTVPTSPS